MYEISLMEILGFVIMASGIALIALVVCCQLVISADTTDGEKVEQWLHVVATKPFVEVDSHLASLRDSLNEYIVICEDSGWTPNQKILSFQYGENIKTFILFPENNRTAFLPC